MRTSTGSLEAGIGPGAGEIHFTGLGSNFSLPVSAGVFCAAAAGRGDEPAGCGVFHLYCDCTASTNHGSGTDPVQRISLYYGTAAGNRPDDQ